MSISDKIIEELRDETYAGGLVEKSEADELGEDFRRVVAMTDQPFGAQMMLGITVAAEAATVALAKFGLSYMLRIFGEVYVAVFGTAALFFIGFFGAFAAYKICTEAIADPHPHIAEPDLPAFSDYDPSQTSITIYLVSAAAGIANVVLVFTLLSIKFG